MTFRVVNEARMNQVMDLWDYCFEKKDDPFYQWYFSEYCGKNNMVIGGFDEQDKLQNMLHLNPYMLQLRGKQQLTPYIVGVATAPEARGQHLFRPLLETTFEVLRSQGFAFALLMPIYAGIYLPYQFSFCYYRHKYDMELEKLQLSKIGSDLQVARMALNKEVLAPIYQNITQAWNGAPVRTDFQWNKLLKVHELENVQCAVVYEADEPCGYMFYKLQDVTFNVLELMAQDFAVRNRLLQFAAAHKSEAKHFTWLAEAWDKTYLSFVDHNVSGTLQPFMMARCLDARLALENLPVADDMEENSVVLLLTDNIIDRNNHLLKIKTAPGKLEAVSTLDEEEATMDMGAFTQLYFGAFTATELAQAGKIKVHNTAKLAVLDKLFPKCHNYINEYF
ncbi:MAG: GNAT family N-acetyltransferase [Phascolarctobacterium sp.]|nr:GNAT family N-acetyltransferase [Phascolarctobacterium sp.]